MSFRRSLLAAILLLASCEVSAQDLSPDEAFVWSVTGPPRTLRPGEIADISATLVIAPEHYVYRESVSVTVQKIPGIVVSDPVYPEPKIKFDKFENKDVPIYEGEIQVRVPIQITAQAPSGDVPMAIRVTHRGCSQEVCYFPDTRDLTLTLNIKGGKGRLAPVGFIPLEDAPAGTRGLFSGGLIRAFLLVFVGGFLTSLTPCVYPLIPVTISIFGARGAPRLEAFVLSLIYVAGICVMYSSLGLIAAGTGAVFGSVMADPIVVGVLMLILGGLGLSMLGVFEIRLPGSLQAVLTSTGGKGYAGAFGMGLVAGVIAAPCTGPVLAGVLVYVAATGDLFLGFWLLFVFALGLGVLFVVIGTFSGAIAYLPRSGPWMEAIKSLFGIVLLAMALYFGKFAYPWLGKILLPLPYGLLVGLALLVLSFPLGWARHAGTDRPSLYRFLRPVGAGIAVLGLYLTAGSFTVQQKGPIDWIYSEPAGLQRARAENRPVLVDVWAEWCPSCKELDATTFRDPQVVEKLKHFVTIKLDFTRDSPERTRLKEKYNITGLPVLLFCNAEGEFLPQATLVGYQAPDELLSHLDSLDLETSR